MALGRWFKRKGSTGSIAHYVANCARQAKQGGMPLAATIGAILACRYTGPQAPLQGVERAVFSERMEAGRIPRTLREVTHFIWDIEIGTKLPPESLERERRECYAILDEELSSLGVSVEAPPEELLLIGEKRVEFLVERIQREDARACALWRDHLGLQAVPTQVRHSLAVAIAAIASQHAPEVDPEVLIDLPASLVGTPQFEDFLAAPDAREGMRALVRDMLGASRSGDVRKLHATVQTFLVAPIGGPARVPEAAREAVVEATASIIADEMTAALFMPGISARPAQA